MFIFCSAIPKNGGHTLIEFLKQFNLKMILVEGSPYHHSLKYKEYKLLPNLNSNEIILGHIPYASFKKNYINKIDADFMTITSIREPIERTISELAFNNNHDDLQIYEYKVKNWAGDAIDNLQTRMLSDDPNFFEKINSSHLRQAIKNMQAIDLIIETNNFIKLFDHFQIDQNIRLNICIITYGITTQRKNNRSC